MTLVVMTTLLIAYVITTFVVYRQTLDLMENEIHQEADYIKTAIEKTGESYLKEMDDVRRTMEEIEKMAPDNVTIHSLALKRAARLNLERDRYRNLSFENSWERMDIASESCARMGLEPYYLYRQKNMAGNFENTGFAAPGKAGIYNILIMEEKQSIVALGAGATTKAVFPGGRIERVENVKDVESYIARINEMIERKRQLFQL